MTLPTGTTKEGERLVVMAEPVFDMLMEAFGPFVPDREADASCNCYGVWSRRRRP